MSDPIKHECGIALIRLRKPLAYYQERYGTPIWGLLKLFLMMEKQHNRGQDGAGVAAMKLGIPAGYPFLFRERNVKSNPLDRIFRKLNSDYDALVAKGTVHPEFADTVKKNFDYGAEVLLGHLRYGTSGGYNVSACHPFFRRSSWPGRNLMLAGNFNLTNTQELNASLIEMGQHPIFATDTQAMLETIGIKLDREHHRLLTEVEKTVPGAEIAGAVAQQLNIGNVLREAAVRWDGGYALAGMVGTGDAFVLRDPAGIRPAFWFEDDEVVAFGSERVALMTVFDKDASDVQEVPPGHAVVVRGNGAVETAEVRTPVERQSCTFERIYFSRGNDPDIYRERKRLGARLADQVAEAVDNDFGHAVFGFIPNTSEVAYYGLMDALRVRRRGEVKAAILGAAAEGRLTDGLLDELILHNWPRAEKVAVKDLKLRTFIGQERTRNQLASHVYDVSYGTVGPDDALVCVDDSIVRGTTLRRSILRMLSRLNPRKIVIVSTAPQIRYPDCYGIDMSELGKFIAFEAAVALIKERGMSDLLEDTYRHCIKAVELGKGSEVNHVKAIYEPFKPEEVSAKICELVRPRSITWKGEFELIFQTVENMFAALPGHRGAWYFTGDYPTPGGYRVVNQSYINYYEKTEGRSY
jgi:amidophosphoribosyltransferase